MVALVAGYALLLQAIITAIEIIGRKLFNFSFPTSRRTLPVVARRATQEEYGEMWAKLQRSYPFFDSYREHTKREIAVVVLERKR